MRNLLAPFFVLLVSVFVSHDTATGQETLVSPSVIQPFEHSPDLFPILPWDVLHGWQAPFHDPKHGLESIADCNFTFAGFVSPPDLPLCEKLGLAAIMAPTKGEEPWFGKWKEMSDEEIDQTVKQMVEAAGNNPAVLGYFIMDEPGAPVFPALAKAVAAVKKYAPGKLAYINLFPSYATVGAPDYVMLVNLSLEKSTNIRLTTVKAYQTRQVVSAEDGRLLPLDDVNGQWLLAGHGVLIKLE
jgi:hypothetical protein